MFYFFFCRFGGCVCFVLIWFQLVLSCKVQRNVFLWLEAEHILVFFSFFLKKNWKKRQLYIRVWFNKGGILLFLKFCPLKAKTKLKGTYLSLYLDYSNRVSWIHSVILWQENWNKEKNKTCAGFHFSFFFFLQLWLKEKHFVEERLAALLILLFLHRI